MERKTKNQKNRNKISLKIFLFSNRTSRLMSHSSIPFKILNPCTFCTFFPSEKFLHPNSTFCFHNCKENYKQNPLVMKSEDMIGDCWGPDTSAGLHGISKCSAHEHLSVSSSRFWMSLTRHLGFGGFFLTWWKNLFILVCNCYLCYAVWLIYLWNR